MLLLLLLLLQPQPQSQPPPPPPPPLPLTSHPQKTSKMSPTRRTANHLLYIQTLPF
ncbi:hypothetical protein E2C01_092031 [Portunus trituberculatus]|uniref:Uncharacterized protein n=1 Tax=Portunus trituberculatus TaxID=210409 RepID=A0A5B7JQA3_PORTR|nr:hypothetical protein [Portunus trituberculatus]